MVVGDGLMECNLAVDVVVIGTKFAPRLHHFGVALTPLHQHPAATCNEMQLCFLLSLHEDLQANVDRQIPNLCLAIAS